MHELITDPAAPSLTLSLKPLPWEPLRSSGLLSMICLLGTCNKCCTFLHRNLLSVDWLYFTQADVPKFVSATHLSQQIIRPVSCDPLSQSEALSFLELLPLFKSCHQGPDSCLPLSWDCALLEISINKLCKGLPPRLSAPVSVAPSNGKYAALGYLWYITCSHFSKCPE